jgi:serine/threonine-protein kinase HipA
MNLAVFVAGKQVARLDALGDFEHVLTYLPDTSAEDFVSLTMPVRSKSWVWPELHPFFQMNLPEGILLKVLQNRFGPHIGGNPLALLAVVGRNTIGRVQVVPEGTEPKHAAAPLDLGALLQGDHSEEAFLALVAEYAESGVSGVFPKFLAPKESAQHLRLTVPTSRYIVKSSSAMLPFVAQVEHFGMEVSCRSGVPTAETEVSPDGQILLVRRFDMDEQGRAVFGFEDLCSLLGLRPANKYETTWERIIKQVRALVPAPEHPRAFQQLATMLLLTYAVRNADCHAKNVALRYTSRADVRMAPVYDMLTTAVYDEFRLNPPGLSFLGKKTWSPGKALPRFIQANLSITLRMQAIMVEQICDAMVDVSKDVTRAIQGKPGFADTGQRLLCVWNDGMTGLREPRTFSLPPKVPGLPPCEPPHREPKSPTSIGRSPLLGPRGSI